MTPLLPVLRRPLAGLAAFALAALSSPASAQDARPDQVFARNPRTGSVTSSSGVVSANDLGGVTLDGGDTFQAALVQRIDFGAVPASYAEGRALFDRGDLSNAAAKFKLAATDDEARDVVRASARLYAAEALLLAAASDPALFADADTAATRFLEDWAQNREVPRARYLRAQAQLGAGNVAKAAEEFRALYREASGAAPTEGYEALLCYRAGLRAADAYLMAEETLAAREIYQAMEAALPGLVASLADDDPDRGELIEVQAEARLGEGYVLLAAGNVSQAKSFFEQQDTGPDSHAALRAGVRLGLGFVHLANGDARSAQLAFARVSSTDFTDRDRVARALTGLVETALVLPDSNGKELARVWTEDVTKNYPDTIWVRRAHELGGRL